ncbi:MAG: hypothetical protein V4615_10930 [Bacteroidota bacterium]
MKKSILLSFVVLAFLTAVSQTRQRQVCLSSLQRTHLAQNTNVVRVYFDKWGNLYPDPAIGIPYKDFFDPYKTLNTFKHSADCGNLERFYLIQKDQLDGLVKHYELQTIPANDTQKFYAVQSIIVKRYVDSLSRLLNAGGDKTLVVLIHGFNDPDPTGEFQQMRAKLKSLNIDKGQTVYLEVYWDGLTANQGFPPASGIWGRAQRNSAYVSLGVRDILQRLPYDTKIRIITHSLGASVGTGALFNTVSKWNKKDADMITYKKKSNKHWDYRDSVRNIPAPSQADIRLGMLAPAIPGGSTFKDFANRGATTVTAANNTITRVIVGFNRNDYAVTKRVGNSDYLASKAGSTTLGCNLEIDGISEIQRSKSVLSGLGFEGIVDEINFTECPKGKREEHGLYFYLLNKKVDEFLGKVFN